MKNIRSILLISLLVSSFTASAADRFSTILSEVFDTDSYSRTSRSEKNDVKCSFTINRGDHWNNGSMYSDVSIWFDEPKNHQGSASSLVGSLASLTDSKLRELLTSKNSFERNEQDALVKVTVNGTSRVIEVTPSSPDQHLAEYNSTFYFKISIANDEVVEIVKKHWQKTFMFGMKKLSFSDSCKF